MYKNNRATIASQEWETRNHTVCESFKKNPEFYIKRARKAFVDVLNITLIYLHKFNDVRFTQQRVADHAGISLSTVKEAFSYWRSLGVVLTNYHHKKPCQYKVDTFLWNPTTRVKLAQYLSALSFLAITHLISPNTNRNVFINKKEQLQIENRLQVNRNLENIYLSSSYRSNLINARAREEKILPPSVVIPKKELPKETIIESSFEKNYIQLLRSTLIAKKTPPAEIDRIEFDFRERIRRDINKADRSELIKYCCNYIKQLQ